MPRPPRRPSRPPAGCAPRASRPWTASRCSSPGWKNLNPARVCYFYPMEPSSTGRGTLTDPEVYGNVPGHIIPIIEREFDDFDNEAEQFLAGNTEETEFIKFRLKQGVYGQRQPDVQMIRVKLPFGGVTPEQMEAFADAIEMYAPLNKGHITTRQNIQVHHVPLPDAAAFIRMISDAHLSSRE